MITKNQQLYFTNINIFSANNDKFPFIASVQEKKQFPVFFIIWTKLSFVTFKRPRGLEPIGLEHHARFSITRRISGYCQFGNITSYF